MTEGESLQSWGSNDPQGDLCIPRVPPQHLTKELLCKSICANPEILIMETLQCTCGCWFAHEHCIHAQLRCGQRASSGVSLQELQYVSAVAGKGSPVSMELLSESPVSLYNSFQEPPSLCLLSLSAEVPGVCPCPWHCT